MIDRTTASRLNALGVKRLTFPDGSFWDVNQIGGRLVGNAVLPKSHFDDSLLFVRWEQVKLGEPVTLYDMENIKFEAVAGPLVSMEVIS